MTRVPIRGPVSAWRLFRLDDGRLVPPFQAWYWPDTLTDADAWKPKGNVGRCLEQQHRVPNEDCTCGLYGVRELSELIAQARALSFAGSSASVLDDCDVLARVVLHGVIYPAPAGTATTTEDPPSAVRASVGSIAELFLPERLDSAAEGLAGAYQVPVTVCSAWPEAAEPANMLQALIGSPWRGLPAEAVTDLARNAADAALHDVTRADLASVLYDTAARPTWQQARAFVDTAIRCFAPESQDLPDVLVHGRPVTHMENLARAVFQ